MIPPCTGRWSSRLLPITLLTKLFWPAMARKPFAFTETEFQALGSCGLKTVEVQVLSSELCQSKIPRKLANTLVNTGDIVF